MSEYFKVDPSRYGADREGVVFNSMKYSVSSPVEYILFNKEVNMLHLITQRDINNGFATRIPKNERCLI